MGLKDYGFDDDESVQQPYSNKGWGLDSHQETARPGNFAQLAEDEASASDVWNSLSLQSLWGGKESRRGKEDEEDQWEELAKLSE